MIELRDVTACSGSFRREHVSLRIDAGQYGVLMGPTGVGKTTVLEAICGLRKVISGRVFLCEQDVTDLSPADRSLGYVPQDLCLFPTMTVEQQIAFPLRIRKWERASRRIRVQEIAEGLGIEQLLSRYPRALSGGEAQRVALARALSHHPKVLLLDEPLRSLDDATRKDLQSFLQETHRQTGMTVLHVTHSEDEAATLADRRFHFS
ncbi:ABC transporter ATP-binding protein [Pirellulaceae bacterium SH501]